MNGLAPGQIQLAIVGATGMVGGYVLRYALDHPSVGLVTVIGRRKLGISHPKLNEVLHQDFADCTALAGALSDQNAAVCCLGVYTGAVPDAEFRKITVDYTVEFARVLRASSPDAAFSFLSGMGADQTGRSRVPFARYKGEAEKALLGAGFPHLYIFRPSYIYPVEPRKEPNFSYRLLRAIYPVFRMLFPNQVIPADDLARAMVDVVVRKTAERANRILENRDIRAVVQTPGGQRDFKPDGDFSVQYGVARGGIGAEIALKTKSCAVRTDYSEARRWASTCSHSLIAF